MQSGTEAQTTHDDGDEVGNGSDTSTLAHDPEEDRAVGALEKVLVGEDVDEAAGKRLLSLNLGLDLSCLGVSEKSIGVAVCLVEANKDVAGFLLTSLLHEPSRRLGEGGERGKVKDGNKCEDDKNQTPLEVTLNKAEGKVEDGAENVGGDNADSLHADKPATSMGRSNLAHVNRRVGQDHTSTNTAKNAEHEKHVDVNRTGLESTGNDHNSSGHSVANTATKALGDGNLANGSNHAAGEKAAEKSEN